MIKLDGETLEVGDVILIDNDLYRREGALEIVEFDKEHKADWLVPADRDKMRPNTRHYSIPIRLYVSEGEVRLIRKGDAK